MCSYYQCIEMLEAQEAMVGFTLSDWPNMKKTARDDLHRKLHRAAYPVTYSRPVSVQELANLVGLGRIS